MRSWYPRGREGRGTDRRAAGLQNSYIGKLSKYDRRYHGATRDQAGPLVTRLLSFGKLLGLVVGPWGDCSRDLHHLIRQLGEHRVSMREKGRGIPRKDDTLGVTIGHIRRILSCTFVRAQALCLLQRIGQLTPSARSAAARRQSAKQLEAARRREIQSYWSAHVKGIGLSRVGMVFSESD